MGFSLIFHFMLGMGASASGVTPPTPTYRPRFVLLRKRIQNSPGIAPPDDVPLRLRKAEV